MKCGWCGKELTKRIDRFLDKDKGVVDETTYRCDGCGNVYRKEEIEESLP